MARLNAYCESFNVKLRDECLNGEIFCALKEAQAVIDIGLRMQQDLKTFQPQIAVKLIDQVKDLREYNLVTSDRLEKLLDQEG